MEISKKHLNKGDRIVVILMDFLKNFTGWKMSVFEVFLVRIFPHSDWIGTRKTANTDTFYAVLDMINHILLLAELNAYDFSTNSLKLMQNYLRNRFRRTNVNGPFSDWAELFARVPQGFFMNLLLFNIFLNVFFSHN